MFIYLHGDLVSEFLILTDRVLCIWNAISSTTKKKTLSFLDATQLYSLEGDSSINHYIAMNLLDNAFDAILVGGPHVGQSIMITISCCVQ